MFCIQCGQKAEASAVFCSRCGAKLELTCPQCQGKLPLDATFCIHCGAQLTPPIPPQPAEPVIHLVEDDEPVLSVVDDEAEISVELVDQVPPVLVIPDELTDQRVAEPQPAPMVEAESAEDVQEAALPPLKNTYRFRFIQRGDQPGIEATPPGRRKPLAAAFTHPYLPDEQPLLLSTLQAIQSPTPDALTFSQDTGARLLGALLPTSEIQKSFVDAYQTAQSKAQPLTVQLRFDSNAVLPAQLPWELLHDGSQHLALSETLHLNRYVTFFGDRKPFPPVEPVRVLVVIARPTDQEDLPLYERDALANAFANLSAMGKVQIDVIEKATFEFFAAQLHTRDYHIIHFDGHGGFDREGTLCFETAFGTTDSVTADRMAQALAGSDVRLVVLSACQSAAMGGTSVFNSLAPALIRARVPAVVAHQFSVPFTATLEFAKAFYTSLGRGESVAAAVADGRKAIALHSSTQADWFYPTLYLRAASGDGYLFSDAPAEHMAQTLIELAELTVDWLSMTPEQQVEYIEGIPLWEGSEITVGDVLELIDQLLPEPASVSIPGLPPVIDVPEIGEMVLIPAGEFLMGTTAEELTALKADLDKIAEQRLNEIRKQTQARPDFPPEMVEQTIASEKGVIEKYKNEIQDFLQKETPQHKVAVSDYYIARQPLRFQQWYAFAKDNGYHRQELWRPAGWQALHSNPAPATPSSPESQWATILGNSISLIAEQKYWQEYLAFAERMVAGNSKNKPQWQNYLRGLKEITAEIIDPNTGEARFPWFRWAGWISKYWIAAPLAMIDVEMETDIPGFMETNQHPEYPAVMIPPGEKTEPRRVPTVELLLKENPEITLTWEEAYAFCQWASQKSFARHGAEMAYFSLAFEPEWEKAARGTDGRRYPWGEHWDESIAEASGGYDLAASPYGILGMCSGNVHQVMDPLANYQQRKNELSSPEWTYSLFDTYPLEDIYRDSEKEAGSRIVRGSNACLRYFEDAMHIICRCAGIRLEWDPAIIYQARVRLVSRSVLAIQKWH